MNILAISGFFTGITCLFLAIFVLWYAKTSLQKTFAFQNFAVALWGFGNGFAGITKTPETALFWWEVAITGAFFIIPLILNHALTLNDLTRPKLLFISSCLALAYPILCILGLIGHRAEYVFNSFYVAFPSNFLSYFYKFFWLYWAGYVSWLVLRGYANAQKNKKFVTILYAVAYMFGLWGGGTYVFFVMFDINIFYPYGNFLTVLYAIIMTYSILWQNLFNIELVIKKTIVFAGLFAFVYAIIAGVAYMAQTFFREIIGVSLWIAMVPSVFIIIFTLKPIEQYLVNITDQFLFQKKYDYKELVKVFASEVLTVLDLDRLVELTSQKLSDIMKLESCSFVLHDGKSDAGGTSRIYNKHDGKLVIPITRNAISLGSLTLGRKKSDEDYTQDDLDIILPLAQTLGIAVSNAQLFAKLGRTRAEAADKEKMAVIGTLAASMAHEIRNPIMTIRTFADFLPERCKDEAFMEKFNKLIPKEIERVDTIARSLLEFSGNEGAGEQERSDIAGAMNVALSLLEPQRRLASIKIDMKNDGGIKAVFNKKQVQESFFNIMKYVISETPDNSTISINIEREGLHAAISIKDKDLRISDYIIRDLFDPLSKVYREKRGFGLELFIAKQLIERNGGAMEIRADDKNGTELIARLSTSG